MGNEDGGVEVRRLVRLSSRKGSIEVVAEPRSDVVAEKAGEPVTPDDAPEGVSVSSQRSPLVVRVPEGTDVVIGTVSGRVTCSGRLGHVAVNTVSARIEVDQAARVDTRTISGRVSVGSCDGEVRCDAGSGRAEVGEAGSVFLSTANGRITARRVRGKVRARALNGRIQVGVTEIPLDVKVECVNGRIEVRVPAGARPHALLRSKNGAVTNALEEGSDGTIMAQTVNGSIVIDELAE
jgi:DUF4097 and DUF4098 domain-containing protein YvlB